MFIQRVVNQLMQGIKEKQKKMHVSMGTAFVYLIVCTRKLCIVKSK